MSNYYRVTTPVQGSDGKTRFREIGVGFPGKEGAKIHMKIKLDAFPANGELVLFEPRSNEEEDPLTE